MTTTVDYNTLAARLTDSNQPAPTPRDVRTGDDAAQAGREFLLREYGTQEAIDQEIRRGRPRVGQPAGASPTVRGRITQAALAELQHLQQTSGRKQSDLVREAVDDLLAKYRHAS